MRRLDLLALFRIAGYHNDQGQFVRLLVENRISKQAADKSYKDGQDMRAKGVKCHCYECRKN